MEITYQFAFKMYECGIEPTDLIVNSHTQERLITDWYRKHWFVLSAQQVPHRHHAVAVREKYERHSHGAPRGIRHLVSLVRRPHDGRLANFFTPDSRSPVADREEVLQEGGITLYLIYWAQLCYVL